LFVVLCQAGPAALVVAAEAAAEDFEEEFDIAGLAWAVDDGEGAGAEGRDDFAAVVAEGAGALDDDGGWRLAEAGEDLEEAGAGLVHFGRGLARGLEGLVEREAEVNDGDMDGVGLDGRGGLFAGFGADGADAHGLQEAWEAVGPGLVAPASVGKEEVEPTGAGVALGGAVGLAFWGSWIGAHVDHPER
jgi:hypothetical protein